MKKLRLLLPLILLSLSSCSGVKANTSSNTPANPPAIDEPDTPDTPEEPETPSTPDTHKVFEAEDAATYFNTKGEEEGIAVTYIEEYNYWYLHYIGEESIDTSKDNLSLGISTFLKYIPLYSVDEGGYMFRYLSKYIDDPETYFIYVAVSSNWFAACSIYSYIKDSHLITDIFIYDGREGLRT